MDLSGTADVGVEDIAEENGSLADEEDEHPHDTNDIHEGTAIPQDHNSDTDATYTSHSRHIIIPTTPTTLPSGTTSPRTTSQFRTQCRSTTTSPIIHPSQSSPTTTPRVPSSPFRFRNPFASSGAASGYTQHTSTSALPTQAPLLSSSKERIMEDHEAMAALLMLNSDRRSWYGASRRADSALGSVAVSAVGKEAGASASMEPARRGLSVQDLLSP